MTKKQPKKGGISVPKNQSFLKIPGGRGAIFCEILVFVQMWSLDEIYRNSYFLESVPPIFWRMDMEFLAILAGDLGQKKTEKIEKMRGVD